MRSRIFISYSHDDRRWLEQLRLWLKPIRGLELEVWDDEEIEPGAIWDGEIRQALESSAVAVLLVSLSFLGSDYIREVELPAVLQGVERWFWPWRSPRTGGGPSPAPRIGR